MTTLINADTIVGGAVITADASGALGLQAAGNTGLTLNSSRAVGVGAGPSFGTAGQVLTSAGSAAAPTWAAPSGSVNISSRTSNTILAAADNAYLINITSGTFSQTFTAAATLGAGWFCYIRNTGTGDITLDPNGAELIDGLSTYIMYTGETRLVQCSGTAFTSVVLSPFYRSFTSSGTFTKPPGYSYFGGLIWSGGASGERTNSVTTIARGGGGGGCGNFYLLASTVGTTETITIGAGGLAVTTVAVGNVGGNSTFGSLISAFAGLNYKAGGSVVSGLITSGIPSFGYEGGEGVQNTSGRTVWGGMSASTNASAAGAASWYGGACGGCLDAAATVRAPGTSQFGGAGGAALSASSGVVGVVPGGGGGATQTGTASGAGGNGEIRIWGLA